jgi:hypothetical protein
VLKLAAEASDTSATSPAPTSGPTVAVARTSSSNGAALTVGIIGLVLGLIGAALGGLALTRSRRRPAA